MTTALERECRFGCGRKDFKSQAGATHHENACAKNPAHRASGAAPDHIAERVRKAAADQLGEARACVSQARIELASASSSSEVTATLAELDGALRAFEMHGTFAKLLEV